MKKQVWLFTTLFLVATSLAITFLFQRQIHKKFNNRSILIIALDDFSSSSLTCEPNSRSEARQGLDTFCQESVRYTHAYTTSTLTLPALTSVLTGLYPTQHQVRDNGENFLSHLNFTVAEKAYQLGYHTSLWSGGAPILRRSGLNQGIEHFRDFFQISNSKIHKPFSEILSEFNAWLGRLKRAPFFSVIYLPDLVFLDRITTNLMGEARSSTYESQLEEFDVHLYKLIQNLKNLNLWDQTDVFLIGLNGRTHPDRKILTPSLNLLSDSTQVPLLWKKSKSNVAPSAQTIDTTVTLADLGVTLFRLLGETTNEDPQSDFPIQDLEFPRQQLRPILIESAWANWKQIGPIRYSIRRDHLVYIHDEIPQVYNSLLDRNETEPLALMHPSILEFSKSARKIVLKNQWQPFRTDSFQNKLVKNTACFEALKNNKPLNMSCDEQSYFELLNWKNAEKNLQANPQKKEIIKRRFVNLYQYFLTDKKLRDINAEIGYLWDINPKDSMLDEALNIPEYQNIKTQVLRAVNQSLPVLDEDL